MGNKVNLFESWDHSKIFKAKNKILLNSGNRESRFISLNNWDCH